MLLEQYPVCNGQAPVSVGCVRQEAGGARSDAAMHEEGAARENGEMRGLEVPIDG